MYGYAQPPQNQGFQYVVSGVSPVDHILSRFPGSCGLTRDPPQSWRSCHRYLADEEQAQRGGAACLKSHSCEEAVLEFSTEGDADGDADDADSDFNGGPGSECGASCWCHPHRPTQAVVQLVTAQL